ncbi:hypothetical protein CBR_g4801 [Chara braunii]|uniref:Uracil-DNA glycosylase-like domain-containing protein n=1 Tax=Chara braunii TaxID=69332 RepID=A0A388KJ30_CHABU|nr:hypothetical protein CBR_g4801 [Chara braunii]|eukprot:GBG69973.1 hypothetical protein CBR_g4801 [Chara braunii]
MAGSVDGALRIRSVTMTRVARLSRGRGGGRAITSSVGVSRLLARKVQAPPPPPPAAIASHASSLTSSITLTRGNRCRRRGRGGANDASLVSDPRFCREIGGKGVKPCSIPTVSSRWMNGLGIFHVTPSGSSPLRYRVTWRSGHGAAFGGDEGGRRQGCGYASSVSTSPAMAIFSSLDSRRAKLTDMSMDVSLTASAAAASSPPSSSSSISVSESAMADALDLSLEEEALKCAIRRIESEEDTPVQVDLRYQLVGMGLALSQGHAGMDHSTRRCFEMWLHFCSVLGKSKTLKALYLQGNNLGSMESQVDNPLLRALSEGLAANTSLEAVHLYANEIADKGADAIAGALLSTHGLPSLEVLELGVNGIGDAGAIALASAIVCNQRICSSTRSEAYGRTSDVGGIGIQVVSAPFRVGGEEEEEGVNEHCGQVENKDLWLYMCHNLVGREGCRTLSASLRARLLSEMMVEQKVDSIPGRTEEIREKAVESENARSGQRQTRAEVSGLIEGGGVFLEGNPGFSVEDIVVRDGVGPKISVEDSENQRGLEIDSQLEGKAAAARKDRKGNLQASTRLRGLSMGDLHPADVHRRTLPITEDCSVPDEMNEIGVRLENALNSEMGEIFGADRVPGQRQNPSIAGGSRGMQTEMDGSFDEKIKSDERAGSGEHVTESKQESDASGSNGGNLAEAMVSHVSTPSQAEVSAATGSPRQSDRGVHKGEQWDSVARTGSHQSERCYDGEQEKGVWKDNPIKGMIDNSDEEEGGGFVSAMEESADSTVEFRVQSSSQDQEPQTSSTFVLRDDETLASANSVANQLGTVTSSKGVRSLSTRPPPLGHNSSESERPTSTEVPGNLSSISVASCSSPLPSSSFHDLQRQHGSSFKPTSGSHASSSSSSHSAHSDFRAVQRTDDDNRGAMEEGTSSRHWSPLQRMLPAEWRELVIGTAGFDCLWEIDQLLRDERDNVLPPYNQIFRALEMCPPEAVRAVILGQDPYPRRGDADGLAFSKPKIEGSLENILEALENDLGCQHIAFRRPATGSLTTWAQQGVLLLNTALTVSPGMSGSHLDEWKPFTTAVITALSNRQGPGIPFALWGRKAQVRITSLLTTFTTT